MDTVYQQILTTVSATPFFRGRLADESDQDYLKRIVHMISQLDDSQWEALPEPAQQWYDGAIDDGGNIKTEVALPAGYEVVKASAPLRRRVAGALAPAPVSEPTPEPVSESESESKPSNGHDTTAALPDSIQQHLQAVAAGEAPRRGRKAKAVKEAKAPRERKPRAVKESKLRKPRARNNDSMTTTIRTVCTRNPTVTVAELISLLEEKGFAVKATSVHQTRAAHIASLRVAQDLGWNPSETPAV